MVELTTGFICTKSNIFEIKVMLINFNQFLDGSLHHECFLIYYSLYPLDFCITLFQQTCMVFYRCMIFHYLALPMPLFSLLINLPDLSSESNFCTRNTFIIQFVFYVNHGLYDKPALFKAFSLHGQVGMHPASVFPVSVISCSIVISIDYHFILE